MPIYNIANIAYLNHTCNAESQLTCIELKHPWINVKAMLFVFIDIRSEGGD